MTHERLRLEIDGPVATLTLHHPESLNALSRATFEELESALRALSERGEIRALIVTGSETAFGVGADVKEMLALGPDGVNAFTDLGQRSLALLESLPYPVIAAVNGLALGGGCELALACDFIYASDKARFAFPEVGLGVIPGLGGTQRLARIVGRARAKELICTGRWLTAAKAKEVGLVLEVLPSDELLRHCRKVAREIAAQAPLAVAGAKRSIDEGADLELRAGVAVERAASVALFATRDKQEGMTAFLEKRPPNFSGE